MAPRFLLAILLGLLTATSALELTAIDTTAVEQEKNAHSDKTESLPTDDGLSPNTDLLPSESRNSPITIIPAITPTKAGGRQGRSFWSTQVTRAAKKSITEAPEELPTPEALTFPVPSFLVNLFGGSQQRAVAPPRQAAPVRRQFQQNPRRSPPRQIERERRPYREPPTPRSRQRQPEDYYYSSEPVDFRDTSTKDRNRYADINGNYDFISDTSYSPRAVHPSRNTILDSDAFNRANNYDNRDKNYRSHPESFDKMEGKGFGSSVNFRDNEVVNFESSQVDYRNEEDYDPLESYYDDSPADDDYDSRNYKPDSAQREKEFFNHKYQQPQPTLFGDIFSSLNPMNYFRTPVTVPPPTLHLTRLEPRTRPGRRTGIPSRFGSRQRDSTTVSPSVTDYFDFSALDSYESREKVIRKQPEFNPKFRNGDHRHQRINKNRGQRLFREEIPTTEERFFDTFPNNKRNRNSGPRGSPQRPAVRRPAIGDIPPIIDDIVPFTQDVARPFPPQRYDPRSVGGGGLGNKEQQHTKRNNPNKIINRSDEFVLNVPSNEIKYEDMPALQQDPRLEPFKYKEDFPLRDDLYVGKDGNIYLKGENTPETEAATLTDSDAFLGLHMYGMDHPLYQEVSKSRTRLIGSESSDSFDHESSKQSRDLSTQMPILNRAHVTDTKEIVRSQVPKLKTTAHRRPSTHRPTIKTSRPTERINPFLTTPGNATPYMSNFAKTLIKVKKAAEEDSRPIRNYDLRHLHDLKD